MRTRCGTSYARRKSAAAEDPQDKKSKKETKDPKDTKDPQDTKDTKALWEQGGPHEVPPPARVHAHATWSVRRAGTGCACDARDSRSTHLRSSRCWTGSARRPAG